MLLVVSIKKLLSALTMALEFSKHLLLIVIVLTPYELMYRLMNLYRLFFWAFAGKQGSKFCLT